MPEDLKFNSDGSTDLIMEGKPIRFVKESDLLAIKSGRESAERVWGDKEVQFNTQLTEANRLREESHQQLLQAQAAKEQLAEQHKDYDTFKTKVGELETELGSHKERLTSAETELAERYRQSLVVVGATEDSLKDRTLDQLRSLVDAAKIFGKELKIPANYDGGKQPGGGTQDLTGVRPMELARRGYEESGKSKR